MRPHLDWFSRDSSRPSVLLAMASAAALEPRCTRPPAAPPDEKSEAEIGRELSFTVLFLEAIGTS